MVDYTKDTGSTGKMMIRDTGTTVQFWLTSGNTSTYNSNLPWSYTDASGSSATKYYDYAAGSGWEMFRSWTVTTDQNVTFRIGDTGTSGIGGPTSFTVAIERSSAPSAPSVVTFSGITSTAINVFFSDGANNGDAIDSRQIGYGTSSSTPQNTIAADGSNTITGLAPGTTYYFWARTHNSKGWSPWGPRSSATTTRVPDAPDIPITSGATQTSFDVSFTDNGNGGSAILERQIAYVIVNSGSALTYVGYTGVKTITGLQPATRYAVWSRVRNAAGWSALSPQTEIRTVAGAWVTVGASVIQAVPYVNVAGVWKLARPWNRVAGVWKETT